MGKNKSFTLSNILDLLKSALLAILITVIGIIILAVVLKFTDINSTIIAYVNDAIKALAIFIMMLILKKKNNSKLVAKAIFAGILYAVLSFSIFSILNGGFALNLGFVYDLIFAVITAVLASVILNILNRNSY